MKRVKGEQRRWTDVKRVAHTENKCNYEREEKGDRRMIEGVRREGRRWMKK